MGYRLFIIGCMYGMLISASATAADLPLRTFIDAAASRLAIADQVALTKWDSGKPVEDAAREQTVIADAVARAGAQGMAGARVTDVFIDQIEANKFVQYSLLAQWARGAGAPAVGRPDLVRDIRPRLDALQTTLITGLRGTSALAGSADCARQVATAAGAYIQKKGLDSLHALALDRALARFCEQ